MRLIEVLRGVDDGNESENNFGDKIVFGTD